MKELENTVENTADRTATGQHNKPKSVEAPGKPQANRLAKNHESYWGPRLKRRSYRDRHTGEKCMTPEWQVRLFSDGKEAWINLRTANKDAACAKAREVYVYLTKHGWDAMLARYGTRGIPSQKLSLEEFKSVYTGALNRVEYPPTPQTASRYFSSLTFVCRTLGVTRINDLTADSVKRFKGDYLERARDEGRDAESVKVSCNAMLRNAAAVFSRQMLTEYQTQGLLLNNPFEGQKLRRIKLKSYEPMNRDMLDKIWADAVRLRDGDPNAPKRVIVRTGGKKAKRPEGQTAQRWKEPDFHNPQIGAYVLLLLELGLGLRRHEADKAEWSWFFTDANGRTYIKIQPTAYFTPKSKESRVIPVEKLLYEAIEATREQVSPFIVPGRLPKRYDPGKEPKNLVYRCDQHHRTLAFWLRKHGIDDSKPNHLLRKEFGSYVATAFGLFHAQRMLGHSSPNVTEAFYAGLTNLPELKHAKFSA